jgi:hypothetical protein
MAVDLASHHAVMEKELLGLLQQVTYRLTSAGLAAAAEYLAAGEYGLALEEIVEGVAKQTSFVCEIAPQVARLAHEMHIEDRPFVKALPRTEGTQGRH